MRSKFRDREEEHVWKPSTKVRSIQIMVSSQSRIVNVPAARSKYFERGLARNVRHSHRKNPLLLTTDARTKAKFSLLELCGCDLHSPGREEETGVDELVEQFRSMHRHFVGVVLVIIRGEVVQVCDDFQSALVVGHLFMQAREVEPVLDVVFVNLDKELVTLQSTKPFDPSNIRIRG